jgi:murein DD-endopeptidase MepM/ murein hydrolase activator NlpD
MGKRKIAYIAIIALIVVVIAVVAIRMCRSTEYQVEEITEHEEEIIELLYGINPDGYTIETGTIGRGISLSVLLERYGVGPATVHRIAQQSAGIFNLRNIRAGNNYTVFLASDSTRRLDYFVYEQSHTEYLVIGLQNDSIDIYTGQREIRTERMKASGTISSSLWNSMIENGMPGTLAMNMSDIYAWSIDFFGLQKGDHFTIIYDKMFVDTIEIGTGQIWGAVFNHGGKEHFAIPFMQGERITYWDTDGNSLRKNFLKAPLQYSRISSRFSSGRMHPILRIVRPHYGVDYAAPAGTPVVAVGDGVITYRGYDGGSGNMIKIKHAGNITSGYMHLRGYATGIVVGKRVSQGDVIGYVGSTGLSTGPHLDYRLWMGNQPIDPLRVPSEPAEPISEENRMAFEFVRDMIMAEIHGDVMDSMHIAQLDSLIAGYPLRLNP